MEKVINLALNKINDYLISIKKTRNGWYELEIGIPKNWVYNNTNYIKCELLHENEIGKILKIIPINDKVYIDDLIMFVEFIIEINNNIKEKEIEFSNKIKELKSILEKETEKFYKELNELKENSFNSINNMIDIDINNRIGNNVYESDNENDEYKEDDNIDEIYK